MMQLADTQTSTAQELARLATRLRQALRGDGADIDACLHVAAVLDRLAAVHSPAERELKVARIRMALRLESRGAALLLMRLLDGAGAVHSHDELERALECSRASIKVFACHLRSALRRFDAGHMIRSVWGVGYRIDAYDAQRLRGICNI